MTRNKKLVRLMALTVAATTVATSVPAYAAFDANYYAQQNPDVVAAIGTQPKDLENHYNLFGKAEGRAANAAEDSTAALRQLFDAELYAKLNPDVVAVYGNDANALFNHFITFGIKEGRKINAYFDVAAYKKAYPDLVNAFGDDIASYYKHFATLGISEHRTLGGFPAESILPTGAVVSDSGSSSSSGSSTPAPAPSKDESKENTPSKEEESKDKPTPVDPGKVDPTPTPEEPDTPVEPEPEPEPEPEKSEAEKAYEEAETAMNEANQAIETAKAKLEEANAELETASDDAEKAADLAADKALAFNAASSNYNSAGDTYTGKKKAATKAAHKDTEEGYTDGENKGTYSGDAEGKTAAIEAAEAQAEAAAAKLKAATTMQTKATDAKKAADDAVTAAKAAQTAAQEAYNQAQAIVNENANKLVALSELRAASMAKLNDAKDVSDKADGVAAKAAEDLAGAITEANLAKENLQDKEADAIEKNADAEVKNLQLTNAQKKLDSLKAAAESALAEYETYNDSKDVETKEQATTDAKSAADEAVKFGKVTITVGEDDKVTNKSALLTAVDTEYENLRDAYNEKAAAYKAGDETTILAYKEAKQALISAGVPASALSTNESGIPLELAETNAIYKNTVASKKTAVEKAIDDYDAAVVAEASAVAKLSGLATAKGAAESAVTTYEEGDFKTAQDNAKAADAAKKEADKDLANAQTRDQNAKTAVDELTVENEKAIEAKTDANKKYEDAKKVNETELSDIANQQVKIEADKLQAVTDAGNAKKALDDITAELGQANDTESAPSLYGKAKQAAQDLDDANAAVEEAEADVSDAETAVEYANNLVVD